MVRTDRDKVDRTAFDIRASSRFALFKKFQHGYNTLLYLITDVQVNFVGATNRVGDVLLENIEGFIEFTKDKNFISGLRVKQGNCVHVTMGHSEDIVRLMDQFPREHPAALSRNVNL